MKVFILILGAVIALTGLWLGRASLGTARQKTLQTVSIEGQISGLKQKIDELKFLPQQPGKELSFVYTGIVNDMNMLARAHRVVIVVRVLKAQGEDVEKAAVLSSFEGGREIEVEIIFSGLKRRGTLLSLMDSISKVEAAWPVIIRRVVHEKDSLTIVLAVVGL